MLRSSQELMGRDLRSREGGELLLFVVDVSSAKAANHSMSDEGIYF
jgi:Mg-chelatase subunit ChlD